ncbi:MAG TPA: S8 family serine peptidase, partial [Solirubrobacteraceae bacterium]|nr:S8 family serine peptidase [Solirubrobacteraceae bacterium]
MGRISRQRKDVAALVAATAALALLIPASALALSPNDPEFGVQWADENAGQLIPQQTIPSEALGPALAATPFADDGATDAWSLTRGSASIVIGEVDTGVDYEHPDLAANIWSNPGGIGGCAPLTHGFDVLGGALEACNPRDEDTTYSGHGTYVAGIMGAVGNNGVGIAGTNWETTILPVKWIDNAEPEGTAPNLIAAINALINAKKAGVNIHVVNDSATYAGMAGSAALKKAIEEL